MGDDDKPFACNEPGCRMRFANEDHLSVHKMKHEMSLPLTPGSRPGSLLFVADQTPTPTKFLRNCEEIGLFNELSKNPFEEAFKKATSENPLHGISDTNEAEALPPSETLNTPNVNMAAIKVTKAPFTAPTPGPEYIPLPGPDLETGSTLNASSAGTPRGSNPDEAIDLRVISPTSSSSRQPRLLPSSKESLQMAPPAAATAISVRQIEAAPATSTVAQTSANFVPPSSQVVTIGVTSAHMTDVKQEPPQYVMQVLLQLPNGQTVSIPAALASNVTNMANVTNVTSLSTMSPIQEGSITTVAQPLNPGGSLVKQEAEVTHVASSMTAPVSSSMITKQKLKAALTQNNANVMASTSGLRMLAEASDPYSCITSNSQGQGGAGKGPSPRSRSLSLASDPPSVSSQLSPGSMSDDSNSGYGSDYPMPSSMMSATEVEMQAADTSTPYGKRARKSPEEDPDERRRKFLERNRAAAARCRQKRKVWINSLEKRAEDFQSTNGKLQQEVTSLRSEVAQLKSLLLAHKDCPIFIQQRNAGKLNLENVPHEVKTSSHKASTAEVTLSLGNKQRVAIASTTSNAMTATTKVINLTSTVATGNKMVTIVPSTNSQAAPPTIISYVNNSLRKS